MNNQIIPFKPLPPIPRQKGKKPKFSKPKMPKAQGSSVLRSAPAARQRVKRIPNPQIIHQGSNGDVTVAHEEFVQDINGSVAFSDSSLAINPGLSVMFPWLSQMAPLYESYKFEKLEFRFETVSSSATPGFVMMAVDYDASDPAAVTKSQLASYTGCVRCPSWEECCNVSSRENLSKRTSYYVRNAPLSANQDIKLYDVGNLNIATGSQAGTTPVGELWVKYVVRLMTPQLLQDGLGLSQSGRAIGTTAGSTPVVTGNLPLTFSGTAGAMTMTATAPYQGLVTVDYAGTGVTNVTPSGTASTTGFLFLPNAANTLANYQSDVSWLPGQTFTLTATATSLSSVTNRIGQYAFSLN